MASHGKSKMPNRSACGICHGGPWASLYGASTAESSSRHGFCLGSSHQPKMSDQTRINAAIRECLDALRPGWSPLAHLAAYLERLRSEPGWSEQEIIEVETAVRRIVVAVIDDGEAISV